MKSFLERLADSRPLLLDGATGTELDRRGVSTDLPLWSTRALLEAEDELSAIHRDYVEAGAEILTANTFRTHARNLAAGGLSDRSRELTIRAVEIARAAAAGKAYVAGSQAPLEDCYSPELVPDDAALAREHGLLARHLADAGVDLLLVETQNTIREAVAATRAAVATGLPALVSFVCADDGRLLSGESLAEAAAAVLPFEPAALLVNCLPADAVETCLFELRDAAPDVPFGAYANIGRPDPAQGWVNTDAQDPAVYAEDARRWLDLGARVIGGCCGTTPAHIRRLRRLIDERD